MSDRYIADFCAGQGGGRDNWPVINDLDGRII